MSNCCRTGRNPLRIGSTIITAVVLAAPLLARADWDLASQMFQSSNVNRNGWCYGYTIVWDGSRLSSSTPNTLRNETWTSDDTALWLDLNVYRQTLELPGWVRLDSGAAQVLINATTIDELANKDQRLAWGPPRPVQPAPVAWRNYNNWLVQNRGMLVRNRAAMAQRMPNLRGGYIQPMTVVLFDQNNQKVRPLVHNVLVYIGADDNLYVWDPNDSAHVSRTATFDNWQLVYTVSNGAQNVCQVWNNVFFTRDYTNRGASARRSALNGDGEECDAEQQVEDENRPDDEWFGDDMPLIDFDPDSLELVCGPPG